MKNLSIFPENLYKHSYSVGIKMYRYAKEILEWNEEDCISMFVLGNIHDLGCVFDGRSFEHAYLLSDALAESYKYYNEIRFHGRLGYNIEPSKELKLLYYGDCTVDEEGNWVTYEGKMVDMINRFGYDSEEVSNIKSVIHKLKIWGFDDKALKEEE